MKIKNYFFCFFAAICLIAASGESAWAKNQINAKIRRGKTMEITSSSFNHEDMIPAKYTVTARIFRRRLPGAARRKKLKASR